MKKFKRNILRFLDGVITFIGAAGFLIIPYAVLILCKIFMK